MGFLFGGKHHSEPTVTETPKISNISYSRCTYGTVVPIIYGTNKVPVNVIDYTNFVAIPVIETTSANTGGGGKGGGRDSGPTSITKSWKYTAYILNALCQGPIVGIGRIWERSNLTSLANEGMTLFRGTGTQQPWGPMPSGRALCYRHLAYVAGNLNLGDNATMGNYTVEVHGMLSKDDSQALRSTEYFQSNSDSGNLTKVYYQPQFTNYVIPDTTIMTVTYMSDGVQKVINNYITYTLQNIPANSTESTINKDNPYTIVNSSIIPTYQQYVIDLTKLATSNCNIKISYQYTTNLDANPCDIIYDLLTNNVYGAGFPESYIDDWTDFRNYCNVEGIFYSPAYTTQDQMSSIVETLANTANAEFVFTQGKLKLISMGDTPVTYYGNSWSPNLTPMYELTDDDFISQDEPITCTRSIQADTYNSATLEYCNRSNSYNTEVVQAQDLASIETYGHRPSDMITANYICSTSVAMKCVQLTLNRIATYRNMYSFKLPLNYILLDPLDVVSITVPELGIHNKILRLLTISEDEDDLLDITAQEIITETSNIAIHSLQQTTRDTKKFSVYPGNVNPIVVFELPTSLTQGTFQISIGASGALDVWGGCTVWISRDGESYTKAGSITSCCRQGILTSTLPVGSDPDITNTLSVDLSMSRSVILSGTQSDADNNDTLCYINGELISYQTATLTSDYKYDITYIRRGCYGTDIRDHTPGSQFCRVDMKRLVHIPFSQDEIGSYLYIKVTSFNVFGGAEQGLADVHPYIYTIRGSALDELPSNVLNVSYSYQGGNNIIKWDAVHDARKLVYEVRSGQDWNNSTIVGQVNTNMLTVNGSGTYFIKSYIPSLDLYSAHATAISLESPRIPDNIIASYDEKSSGWTGYLQNCYIGEDGNVYSTPVTNVGISLNGGSSAPPTVILD